MAVVMNKRELRQMVENMPAQEVATHIQEALDSGALKPSDFSIRQLFEATVEDGRELLETYAPGSDGNIAQLIEAGSVDTSLFKNISGQMVYSEVLAAYEQPSFIGDKLARTIPTKFDGEKIPGITQIGDHASAVLEGQPYPRAGVSEDYVETPQTTKNGLIVEVTKEAIFFDRTGILLDRCNKVGEWLGVKKEKAIIDVALGVTNNWKPLGEATNTYSNSTGLHTFDNLANSNSLADYSDINAAQQLLEAITDPWTGEPVIISGTQLVCTTSLAYTARSIINATQVELNPNSNAGTAKVVNYIPPMALIGQNIDIVTNPWVAARMTAGSVNTSNWYFGDFRKAFAYMENWPITVVQAPPNSEQEFQRDIVAQYKASERGVAAVLDPRYVVLNAPA
jgi:hypothetical protein